MELQLEIVVGKYSATVKITVVFEKIKFYLKNAVGFIKLR